MAAVPTTDQAPTTTPPIIPLTGCHAVEAEASKYSGWDANIVQAIAHAESTQHGIECDIAAKGDGHLTFMVDGRTYGYSVSVLQVRILPGREHCDVFDLAENVKCAYAIWQGQGYNAWTKYTNGEYRNYLQ